MSLFIYIRLLSIQISILILGAPLPGYICQIHDFVLSTLLTQAPWTQGCKLYLTLEQLLELWGHWNGDIKELKSPCDPGLLGQLGSTNKADVGNVTLGENLSGGLVDGLTTSDENVGGLLGKNLAGGVLELHADWSHLNLDGRWVSDLHGVLEGIWASDLGLENLSHWAVHGLHLDLLLVDNVGRQETESLDGTLAIVEVHGSILIELNGLGVSLVGVHVGDLDTLRRDVDLGTLGTGFDFWEVEVAKDTLRANHLDSHGSKDSWSYTSVVGARLDLHGERTAIVSNARSIVVDILLSRVSDTNQADVQLGLVQDSLHDGVHIEGLL
jgi:hypothetical protein